MARIVSGGTPSKARPEYWDGDIPWVSAKDMKEFRLASAELSISLDGLTRGSKLAPQGAALVLVRGMTLLKDVPICMLMRDVAFNQDVKAILPRSTVHPAYLAYALLAAKPELCSMVELAGHGTGRLPTDRLSDLRLPVHQRGDQQAIAHILGTLDEKIQLNRRMNETLEGIAQSIFRSWFVDFDPVRANMSGHQPLGLSPETATLFPDAIVDSELGPVPLGWSASVIDAEYDYLMGQAPPGSSYNETGEGVPLFQGKAEFGFRFPAIRMFCTQPTRIASAGDTLVSVRAPVGAMNMARVQCCIGRGLAAVRHKSGRRSFTYYSLRELTDQFAKFDSEGTVFGSISKQAFGQIQCVRIPESLVSMIDDLLSSIDSFIERSEEELETLANLRESLLPPLVSGALRVQDAEGLVESAL